MAKLDPEVLPHLEWLGFVRPTGLVVSAPALVRAGAILDRRDMEGQRLLRECIEERTFDTGEGPAQYLPDFQRFASSVLGWTFSAKGYTGTSESTMPEELEVPLPDYGETLSADFAVRELDPKEGASSWQLLVRVLEPGEDFDHIARKGGQLEASAHGRMERLLRQTGVPAGLLFNGRALRLLSAPRGESSGWLDFRVADMVKTAGRPISTALRLLLSQERLLSLPRAQRFAALLEDSRKFQNEVSERLAQQVLHALYELLRGLQSAHDASKGELLREPLSEHPDEVYRALLTVILRLVFLLYAEERDMLPEDETFLRYYSLAGLYERLREDAALYPDTMDQRFGGWAQLLVLFRLVHDGADTGNLHLPRRHGVLFDPDRYKFLEGRPIGGARQLYERIEPPLIPDGTIYRALEKLLVLDGERISYRALDVEQIGSVYETMMGFRLETATGRSVAIKAQKKQGAPTAVDLEALLGQSASKREKWLQERTDRKLTDTVKRVVVAATTVEDLHAALMPVVDSAATPDLVPKGAMVLQPSNERRRSGSHYTPRALTEPIVRTTLEPILVRLRGADGKSPRPEQILDLKVCDPAMGSGAFLVEACRQLGDALVEAWHAHGAVPEIPPDEDELTFARRLIAQRCLYGVDRNPVAVDLAKVSLWLVTLAKDHPLTFVDHALRHGDSLVGLSRKQLEAFHWDESKPPMLQGLGLRDSIDQVSAIRKQIREASDGIPDWELRDLWENAQFELGKVRLIGDLVLAAFFSADLPIEREKRRGEYASAVANGKANQFSDWLKERRYDEQPFTPFQWEIEFPEVFGRKNPGFDAFIGNPPFAGKNSMALANEDAYADWLKHLHEGSHGNADLVAHFFRRAFNYLRKDGTFGLIATNTIGQGDTRATGLRWICTHGGEIYAATRRVKWPGLAAVVVSVVHIVKGTALGPKRLDNRDVGTITAFLFHRGSHEDPKPLLANEDIGFIGYGIYGPGFTFDDSDSSATSISEMNRLLQQNTTNKEVIFPYLGGDSFLRNPSQGHSRFVINFGTKTLKEVQRWPDLLSIVEKKVRPYRESLPPKNSSNRKRSELWWQFGAFPKRLDSRLPEFKRILMHPFTSNHVAFGFVPSTTIVAAPHIVLLIQELSAFATLQSRIHEIWVRMYSSSMKDDLRYTPSDCFETFPFPEGWNTSHDLEKAGDAYYQFRAQHMINNDEGLTKTYNRFHDPDDQNQGILKLRSLHAAIDRAVLDAYKWTDIPTNYDFLLDYEIDEEEWGDKKKPFRYRWPDKIRDEVLARLIELNGKRANEEGRAAISTTKQNKKVGAKSLTKNLGMEDLFS